MAQIKLVCTMCTVHVDTDATCKAVNEGINFIHAETRQRNFRLNPHRATARHVSLVCVKKIDYANICQKSSAFHSKCIAMQHETFDDG